MSHHVFDREMVIYGVLAGLSAAHGMNQRKHLDALNKCVSNPQYGRMVAEMFADALFADARAGGKGIDAFEATLDAVCAEPGRDG